MDKAAEDLLRALGEICENPNGAHNIRINGKVQSRASTDAIKIEPRPKGDGINIHIKAGTKNETIFIPVVLTHSGLQDVVYNDFHIGKNCEVTIAAGCGIHNDKKHLTQHDGIHTFHIGAGSRVKYVETHQGRGKGNGAKKLNPTTMVNLAEKAVFEMETTQIKGVDVTERITRANVGQNAKFITNEKLMTDNNEVASTKYEINLDGENSSSTLSSRSVARGTSKQAFYSVLNGNNLCHGHSECDAIIDGKAIVKAVPDVTANHPDAQLIHEAAIGKIAGEQIIKLMTLGLTREQAEAEIIAGFLS